MTYSEEEFQIEIDGLAYELKVTQANVQDFSRRHFNGPREKAVVYCLSRAADIAEGCLELSKSNLPVALNLLDRGLFECLIWIRWVAQSDENAKIYQDLGINELKRILRKNLKASYGTVFDKTSQEDKSQEFLESPEMQGIPKRLKIENIAIDTGLGKLYTQIYGYTSLLAHGTDFGLHESTDADKRRFLSLASANATLACINLVAKNWIVNRAQTEIKEIYEALGLGNTSAG